VTTCSDAGESLGALHDALHDAPPAEARRVEPEPGDVSAGGVTRLVSAGTRERVRTPLTLVSVTLGAVGVVAGFYAAGRAPREPELGKGEVLLFRGHPRRSFLRYALSLGLWELSRRSTSFAVTERRVVVDRGLFRRHTHSIPLSGIGDVDAISGLWEGMVRVSGRGTSTPLEELGPFRAKKARAIASTIARAVAVTR
jgi:hypothetical protein